MPNVTTFIFEFMTEKEVQKASNLDLFKTSKLRTITLILISTWFINNFVYYGLAFNVGSFGMNIYITQLVFGFMDFVHLSCIWLLNIFGWKKCQGGFLLLSRISCLLTLFFSEGTPLEVTVLAVIAKLGISCSFSTAYVYSAELFPIVISWQHRQPGLGLVSMSARIGGIIVPLFELLRHDYPALPTALFGSALLVAAGLSVLLPETVNKELPDQTSQVGKSRGKVNSKNDLENGHNQTTAENRNFIEST